MFPKSPKELQDFVTRIWNASIKSLNKSLEKAVIRLDSTEKEIVNIDKQVEENTEKIYATKQEVEYNKRLIALLVFELEEQGFKVESQELINLLNCI